MLKGAMVGGDRGFLALPAKEVPVRSQSHRLALLCLRERCHILACFINALCFDRRGATRCARSCHVVVLACTLLSVGCEWRNKQSSEPAPARVDSVAARAFDDLAYEGGEVFLTMLPINVAEPDVAKQQPQICLFEVNFLRQVIESNESGTQKLLESSARPLNAYAFTSDDIAAIRSDSERERQSRRPGPQRNREESLTEASQVLRKIVLSLGIPSETVLECNLLGGAGSRGPRDSQRGPMSALIERAKVRLSERRKRENAAIFGPEGPLFARTLDETTVEPLHSGEYALILGRMKQLALKHDFVKLASTNGQERGGSGERVLCAGRFELRQHLQSLQEIVSAFPAPRQIPGRPDVP